MFGLFKKNLVTDGDLKFLTAIISLLPNKYSYLLPQINKEFLLSKEINPLGDKGTYVFASDEKLGEKFANHDLPSFFIIKGIRIFNKSRKIVEDIELHIHYGTLIGFKVISKYKDLDFDKIDVSDIEEQLFTNEDKINLDNILGNRNGTDLSFLDLYDTFKIEIDNEEYYVIKDLEDGNYLSVNTNGAVFGMINDPYEIELLFDDFDGFLKAINDGSFNIKGYIAKKLS